MVRLLNFKTLKRNDLSALNFEGFIQFFIQAAVFIFSKAPNSLSHLAPAALANRLFDHFKQAAKNRGERTPLYDNPHATSLADQDVINQLTKMVESDPEFQLPEGYKKVDSKQIQEQFVLRDYFELPEETRICAEIMDDILGAATGTHILEPMPLYTFVPRVMPVANRPRVHEGPAQRYMQPITKEPRKLSVGASQRRETEERSQKNRRSTSKLKGGLDEMSAKLSPAMKLAIACASKEDKGLIKEVADVLGDIVEAVEKGRSYIKQGRNGSPVNNKVRKERAAKEQEMEAMKRQAEQKRKQRHEKLKVLVEEGKVEKERRQIEEKQKM